MIAALYVLVGLFFLLFSGELLVKGAVSTAGHFRLSPFAIAATIVSFGTSAPELVVSVTASLGNHSGIALGNVVGSNIANILLALGLVFLLNPNQLLKSQKYDTIIMITFTLIFIFCVTLFDSINRLLGLLFILGLLIYIIWVLKLGESDTKNHETKEHVKYSKYKSLFFLFFGILGVLLGAKFLVMGSVDLASIMGVSETVIGLSVVALGTSLPEAVISSIAVLRNASKVAVGAVVGSNIFNLFGIVGFSALFRPLDTLQTISFTDILLLFISTLFISFFILKGIKKTKPIGFLMLICYMLYVSFLYAY